MALTSNGKLYGWGWNKVVDFNLIYFSELVSIPSYYHQNVCQLDNKRTYGVSCHEIKTFCLHSLDRLVLVTMWTIALLYKLDFHMSRQLLFPYLWWIYMFMTSMTTIFLQVCPSQSSLTFTSLGFHLQKVVHISCGWRHTLAFTERQNVFSWGRGTNGQLGHGESIDR